MRVRTSNHPAGGVAATTVRATTMLAVGRVLLGTGALLAPGSLAVLGTDSVTVSRLTWLIRGFGARDAVLGVGLLVGGVEATTADRRRWVVLAGVCDLVDGIALASAVRSGLVRRSLGVPAVGLSLGAAGVAIASAAGAR